MCSPRVCKRSVQGLLAFMVCGEKSGMILIGLSLLVFSPFSPTAFKLLLLSSAFGGLIITFQEAFLFWPSLFRVLWASYMFMSISFFRLGNFLL